jgi:dihydrofolate synthase/folylpolyglutamate synthase
VNLDSLLKPYQRFGVHLGLERIQRLLADLGNPQQRVPIIHVTGTNGKGSVCAYLSAVLTEAGYRVGRYTSPHLIDWTERICLNERPIAARELAAILKDIQQVIPADRESPTQFEVITAAAWLYFARSRVDIAVMEVGLGGRLDATNVCDRPLVSAITSLSREHWQNLGSTLADIAREKAGILKAGCPAAIGNLPPEAKEVIAARIAELECPAVWVQPSVQLRDGWARYESDSHPPIDYPLPLLGDIQLMNSAIAIACLQLLVQQGWNLPNTAIEQGMAKTRWLGRLQWTQWRDRPLLVDGAHNPAAAIALRQYVDTIEQPIIPISKKNAAHQSPRLPISASPRQSSLGTSKRRGITWVMGILSTKDHADIFSALLREGDRLYLVPVPDHSTAAPEALAALAQDLCPTLDAIATFTELIPALDAAIDCDRLVVLCGSLYLVGYFLAQASGKQNLL